MANINFGTDGWRAILGSEFNLENVEIVTIAIAKYLFENHKFHKQVLIGYDPRKNADFYAKECADILAKKGFTVLLSDKIVPTPILAYHAAVTGHNAIMFTASHNPPEYLGMKFIPFYGGPATDDITAEITSYLGDKIPDKDGGSVTKTDFSGLYFDGVGDLINLDRIRIANIPFLYDGFYSATIGNFDKLLEYHKINYTSIRMNHDPNFGGSMPDPKPENLKLLMSCCKTMGNVGFANDGDGDRFGVIDENGEYVSPNEIISILAMHLKTKTLDGAIVKTVGSSLLIDKVAEKLNVPLIETAVGFKHIGQAMRETKVLIGGEESGGLSVDSHIPEKDGIFANLLVLEAMAYSGKKLCELRKELRDFVGEEFITDRIDYILSDKEKINQILEHYKSVETIGEYSILRKSTIDGVKLYLDDSTTILIRPSGTEPLLRVYFESSDATKIEELKKINYAKV